MITVKRVETEKEYQACLILRKRVFMGEQKDSEREGIAKFLGVKANDYFNKLLLTPDFSSKTEFTETSLHYRKTFQFLQKKSCLTKIFCW